MQSRDAEGTSEGPVDTNGRADRSAYPFANADGRKSEVRQLRHRQLRFNSSHPRTCETGLSAVAPGREPSSVAVGAVYDRRLCLKCEIRAVIDRPYRKQIFLVPHT